MPALHRAHGKTCKVEIAPMIHARHFRRLAADQRAARRLTACRNAVDDAGGLFHIQLACGKIIKEKQWLCPLADQIIDAHRHQIHADCVHMARVNRNAQFGAHTIRCRHQNRVFIPRAFQIKQRAKPAKARHHPRPRRAFGRWLDRLDQRIARINVHARLRIGQAFPPCVRVAHQGASRVGGIVAAR